MIAVCTRLEPSEPISHNSATGKALREAARVVAVGRVVEMRDEVRSVGIGFLSNRVGFNANLARVAAD